MPTTTFRPDEVKFLESFIEEWRKLKGNGGNQPHVKGRLKPKNKLLREIIDDFYEKFPDRDSLLTDANPYTFDDDERKRFPERVRQWLNNRTRDAGGREGQHIRTTKTRTTARHLVQQTYKSNILLILKDVLAQNPDLEPMTAYNQAVSKQVQELKENNVDEWEKMETLANEIRTSGSLDYTNLSPEALLKLLGSFPTTLLNHVTEWSRSLPVHVYCLAVFSTPEDPTLKSYTITSPSLNGLEGSSTGELMRDSFLGWMEDNLGAKARRRPEDAAATVYPSRESGLRPLLPTVSDPTKVDRAQLESWIRLYMNYLYKWQGGKGAVPWSRINKLKEGVYVDSARLPEQFQSLSDPHGWNRPHLEAVYRHILAGQRKELPDENIFQFRRVDRGNSGTPIFYQEFCVTRPDVCELVWGPEEKLYALRVAASSDASAPKASWNGLPLCRTELIYVPFDRTLGAGLKDLTSSDLDMASLLSLLNEMERYGPVHTSDSRSKDQLNAHFPPDLPDKSIRSYIGRGWLPESFFVLEHPEHPQFALSTFIHWVQAHNRFRHPQTGTWRGGPNGVRWVVAVLARMVTTFTIYQLGGDVPSALSQAIEASLFDKLRRQLCAFCAWLMKSLLESVQILKKTYTERSLAWKAAVVSAHLTGQVSQASEELDRGRRVTNGVPTDPEELLECYNTLTQTNPEMTMGDDNDNLTLIQRIANPTRRLDEEAEAEFTGSDDESPEEIELPDSGSSDEGLSEDRSTASLTPSEPRDSMVTANRISPRELPVDSPDGAPHAVIPEEYLDDAQTANISVHSSWVALPTDLSVVESAGRNPGRSSDDAQPETLPPPAGLQVADCGLTVHDIAPANTSGPLATRRTRRTVARNAQAQEAIDAARKGKYQSS